MELKDYINNAFFPTKKDKPLKYKKTKGDFRFVIIILGLINNDFS